MAPIDSQLYDLLGVDVEATQSEIKKAYHNLVRREHPDKKPEHERDDAAVRFREIQEAYDILREPESRALYDEQGLEGLRGGSNGAPGGMDMDDLFAQMFGMGVPGGKDPSQRKPRKQNVEHDYPVTLEELYRGKSTKMKGTRNKICPHCTGSGCRSGHKPTKCASCDGKGTKTASMMVGPGMYSQQQVVCPSCEGTGSTIKDKDRCRKCKGQKVVDEIKVLEIFVDRGMYDGDTIVLQGQADETPGGETGDVIITLVQKEHDVFTRLGADLRAALKISLAEALCGFSRVILEHLDGRLLRYTSSIGKVLRPGQVIVVQGEGMPLGRRRDGFGNLYLEVDVEFPKDHFLSEKGEYGRLSNLLPPSMSTSVPTATGDKIEESIVGAPGSMLDFGGEEARARADTEWEDDEPEAEPGMQCNQQ